MIPADPLITVHVQDAEVGLNAYVALHNLGEAGACGGIRCVPDITVQEVQALARAMAYKYAFFERPHGGGKGGMVMDYDTPPARRQELARCLGWHLKGILRTGLFLPWTDMNFNADDVTALYRGAGMSSEVKGESSRRTALSTLASVIATAEALQLPPERCRVAIEGLGNVGGFLAAEIVRWGGRVVAVSNREGAVINDDGLAVDDLLARRSERGTAFVHDPGPWKNVAREDLFDVEAEIIVPCARVGSLDDAVARRISARAVVPAANVPCTDLAEQILAKRGILLLPDFVVNAGGILGIVNGEQDKYAFFITHFKQMMDRLIGTAQAEGLSPLAVARRIADQRAAAKADGFFRPRSLLEKTTRILRNKGLLPNRITNNRAQQRQRLEQVIMTTLKP